MNFAIIELKSENENWLGFIRKWFIGKWFIKKKVDIFVWIRSLCITMTSQEGEKIVDTENDLDHDKEELTTETKEDISTAKPRARRYLTKHMKLYPELYRSDVSIHPSYTTLKNLP